MIINNIAQARQGAQNQERASDEEKIGENLAELGVDFLSEKISKCKLESGTGNCTTEHDIPAVQATKLEISLTGPLATFCVGLHVLAISCSVQCIGTVYEAEE